MHLMTVPIAMVPLPMVSTATLVCVLTVLSLLTTPINQFTRKISMPIYLNIPTRTRLGVQFPELLRTEDEDCQFVDSIDQLDQLSVFSDGRTMAHIQDH